MSNQFSNEELIERFVADCLQPDELEQFFLFLEQTEFQKKYNEVIDMELLHAEFSAWSETNQAKQLYDRISRKAGITPQNDSKNSKNTRWKIGVLRWAAAVFVFTISYFVISQYEKPQAEAFLKEEPDTEVMPGQDKAVLTLANGKQIQLSKSASGTIQDGSLMIDNQDGKLSYQNTNASSINTVTTPSGGQYQLILSDGTKVWLNAASSITFPTTFFDKSREVSVTGEVYFEVKHHANKPFKVLFDNQQVEVIGTTFNINSYPEEAASITTLIEGSVRVSRDDNKQLILKPNQQSISNEQLTLNKAPDLSQVLAWKNGTFNFNGQDFAASMRQLERWYNIKVVYDSEVPTEKLGGEVDRNLTLNQVLKVLNGIIANFKLDGNVLHVIPMSG